jgi:hypothetical protein
MTSYNFVIKARHEVQGCQIFLAKTYQNGEKIPNYHKIYPEAVKY